MPNLRKRKKKNKRANKTEDKLVKFNMTMIDQIQRTREQKGPRAYP